MRVTTLLTLLGLLVWAQDAIILKHKSGGGGGGGYLHYRSLTTAHAQAGTADSPNFPISSTITLGAGKLQHANCYDFVVATDHNLSNPAIVPFEIETCNQSTGVVTFHFLDSNLSHTADQVFYAVYDNSAIGTPQNTGANAPAHLCDGGYVAMLHHASTSALTDVCGNGNNETNTGLTNTTGQLNGALANDGTGTNKLAIANNLYTMIGGSATHTVSFWLKMAAGSAFAWDGDTSLFWGAGVYIGSDRTPFWGYGGTDRQYPGDNLSLNVFHHVVAVKTAAGDNGNFYVDGTLRTVHTGTLGDPLNSGVSRLASYQGDVYGLNGAIDEFRVATAARSQSWVTAEYNNQKSGSTFLTVGVEN